MKIKNVKLKIIGMHCTSCAFNIDGELEDTTGIHESTTSYARLETEVSFDTDTLSEKDIIRIIKKVGYDAKQIP